MSVTLKRRKIENNQVKFKLGDKVRIGTNKGVFTKGHLPNWSTEIFTVVKINKTLPVTYALEDYLHKPIAGCFYQEQIHKTNHPDDYQVEKFIRRKGNRVFVKLLGFDSSHNSWINTSVFKK